MFDKNYTLKQFGKVIKEKRLTDGISSTALSNSVKISRATLSSVENGNGNVSFNTYLALAETLGINISFEYAKSSNYNRIRIPKRITKEKTKKNQFEVFCIEKYATHAGLISNTVYSLFKSEGLIDILRSDYEDLHGMSEEYLMQFFDSYLRQLNLSQAMRFKMADHSTVKSLIITEVIKMISDKYKVSLEKAMDTFYSSKTCSALSDDKTNLYSQSALFLFSLYETEVK